MDDEFYIQLEDRFRGSREVVKNRLQVYLPIITLLNRIYPDSLAVDLGCGRGEWLELLRENGWQGVGIDKNRKMVDYCNGLGIKAEKGDAITYLHSIKSESIVLVTGFHIAEHLEFESLIDLVKEAYRTLFPGGFLILETPNPENILVGTNTFYVDPTHLRPLPTQLLSFLPEYFGFMRTKILRLQESGELTSVKTPDLLNVLTGVSPDYAVIAQKDAPPEVLEVFDDEFAKEYGITIDFLAHNYSSQIEGANKHSSNEIMKVKKILHLIQTEILNTHVEVLGIKVNSENNKIEQEKTESKLQTLINEIQNINIEHEKTQSELGTLRADLANINAERENTITKLQSLKTDLTSIIAEREKLQVELDTLKIDLHNTNEELENQKEKLNEVKTERDSLQAAVNVAISKGKSLQEELSHVYGSRSYRITAPMRTIFGKARIWRDKLFATHNTSIAQSLSAIPEKNSGSGEQGEEKLMILQSSNRFISGDEYKIETIQSGISLLPTQETPNINLDEIMEKIRQEIEKNKSQSIDVENTITSNIEQTKLFIFIKKMQAVFRKLPLYKQINGFALLFKKHIPKYQQIPIAIDELLKYEDESFIINAYKQILDREPDDSGFRYYLYMLKTGSMNKIRVIKKLRYSNEGKSVGKKIKGLSLI
jgi:SAM-dependent methyltransferase